MQQLFGFIRVATDEYVDGSAEVAEMETGEYHTLGDITPAQKATLQSSGTLKIGGFTLVDVFRDLAPDDTDDYDDWRRTL